MINFEKEKAIYKENELLMIRSKCASLQEECMGLKEKNKEMGEEIKKQREEEKGQKGKDDVIKLLQDNPIAFLQKPYSLPQLLSTVHRIIHGARPEPLEADTPPVEAQQAEGSDQPADPAREPLVPSGQ